MATVHYHEGKFPPRDLDWSRLIPLIGPANVALARYDGILSSMANPALLLSPLSTQEAVLSSRIEGTQATMSEVLEFEADENSVADATGLFMMSQPVVTVSCDWQSCTPSSKRYTPFWMGTAVSDACSCRCTCLRLGC